MMMLCYHRRGLGWRAPLHMTEENQLISHQPELKLEQRSFSDVRPFESVNYYLDLNIWMSEHRQPLNQESE